ncbi:MAG: FAD-dependent oxidoreductase [Oxalobacter sp.]|nr:MAG: FAD-dependent oxidoreductase [Oxalobacter sp.]
MTSHVLIQDLGLKKHSSHHGQWKVNENAVRVTITIDGKSVSAETGDNVLIAARKAGIEIPSMCSDSRTQPNGDCGLCVIEVDGNQAQVKACETLVREGMSIVSQSEALTVTRRNILNNYLSNHNAYCLPPCSFRCPANIDIPGYLGLIAQKKYVEATALIKEKLPLPQIIGRVCPRPCESVCRRAQVDEEQPVAICSLKRFAADRARELNAITQPKPKAPTGKKVAVIGAGPAGLTAAYFLALEGHKVTIFEAQEAAGGMLRYGIPPYRLPNQVLDDEVNDILALGVEIKYNQRLGTNLMLDTLQDQFDATFLAIGAMVGKMARIPNETVPGVMAAVDFLAKVNRGERVDLGQNVVVIGGGFTAADAVRTARRMGAPNVTLSYRRTRKEMPASPHEIHDCEVEGVILDLLSAPVEVKVNEQGRSVGLVCQRMQLGEPDASGRRSPVPVPDSNYLIPADTVLLAISQDVDVKSMKVTDIKTTSWGSILIDDKTMKTNLTGIFSGGDASLGAATAVEGIGHGRRAAYAIDAYLRGADDATIAKVIEVERPKFFDIGARPKQKAKLTEMPVLPQEERVSTFGTDIAPGDTGALSATGAFTEVELGFTEEQAITEAERCLQCVCQAAGSCDLQRYSLQFKAGTKQYLGPQAFAHKANKGTAPAKITR